METMHAPTARPADVRDIMEDVAHDAYIHYHGRCYEAMKQDKFRFLPRFDPNDGTWVIQKPQAKSLALDAIVRHMHALQMVNEGLWEELCEGQDTVKHFQNVINNLRAQLGMPPIYKKKPAPYTVIDTAP